MEKLNEIKSYLFEVLQSIWPILSKIVLGIVVLIVAIYVIKYIVKLTAKFLKIARVDKLDEKLNDIEIVEGKKLNFNTVKMGSKLVKWLLYIVLIITASDILELKMISIQISALLVYLPKLFAALAIFVLGLLFANFVKNSLKSLFESMDLSGGKMLSQAVFFLLLTFISITALNQAGIDTTIITNNINMIIAAFLLAFAIAFGFGAREIVSKLLKTFYARKTFEIGKNIIFNDTVYTIEAVENISVTLKNSKGKLIIPINDLVEQQVQMQDQL